MFNKFILRIRAAYDGFRNPHNYLLNENLQERLEPLDLKFSTSQEELKQLCDKWYSSVDVDPIHLESVEELTEYYKNANKAEVN